MEAVENIKALCGKADNPKYGYAQITIDFFEEFESQFFSDDRDVVENPIERDEVLAKAYEIGNILDIIDRVKFKDDVVIFEQMHREIHSWGNVIQARNMTLGIPRHRG